MSTTSFEGYESRLLFFKLIKVWSMVFEDAWSASMHSSHFIFLVVNIPQNFLYKFQSVSRFEWLLLVSSKVSISLRVVISPDEESSGESDNRCLPDYRFMVSNADLQLMIEIFSKGVQFPRKDSRNSLCSNIFLLCHHEILLYQKTIGGDLNYICVMVNKVIILHFLPYL